MKTESLDYFRLKHKLQNIKVFLTLIIHYRATLMNKSVRLIEETYTYKEPQFQLTMKLS
jgi:hypothetical protein